VEDLAQDITELAKDRKALLTVQGIGPKMADKIIEFSTTGKISEHAELAARVPPGLLLI
jgi:DNA polymerase/3'-5' exonuclease PolX